MTAKYEKLTQDKMKAFAPFTFKMYRPLLTMEHPEVLAVGATIEGRPVGLILGTVLPDHPENIMIRSLFVMSEYRMQGIGKGLVEAFEKEASTAGHTGIEVYYIDDKPTSPCLEHILLKLGYSKPVTVTHFYRCFEDNLHWSFLKRCRVRKPFTIEPLYQLTEEEKDIISNGAGEWYPKELYPFHQEWKMCQYNSLVIKDQGQVVGWIRTNKVSEKAIGYMSVFMKEEYRSGFGAAFLFAASIRAHFEHKEDSDEGILEVRTDNKRIIDIVENKILKGVKPCGTKYLTYKYIAKI